MISLTPAPRGDFMEDEMTSRDFCYWLQGYFEIHGNRPVKEPESTFCLNDSQIDIIRRHLALVFKHEIDPSFGPQKVQDELNNIHDGSAGPSAPNGLSGSQSGILIRC